MSEYLGPIDLPDVSNFELSPDDIATLANQMFRALPSAVPFLSGISGLQAAAPPFGQPSEKKFQTLLAEEPFVTAAEKSGAKNSAQSLRSEILSNVPRFLESQTKDNHRTGDYRTGDYHQTGVSDHIAAQPSHLPGEQQLLELLTAEFRFTRFDAPASAATLADARFYFLDSAAPPVFGNVPKQNLFAAEQQGFDVQAIRRDFPILAPRVNGRPLIWFDNAATTHKPKAVIDRIGYFYEHENSNIHRAAHELAARATDAYEGARNKVAKFIGAQSVEEIIFVRGATEGINLLANTFGKQRVGLGDEIVLSQLEHHANIVPWYQLAHQVGAKIRVIPVDDSGQILLDEYRKLISSRTKIVSVTHVSNALGTVTPIREIIDIAHSFGVPVIVDGAQSISHTRVNVQTLDADFFVFSGHKVFGPTGIGIVYGKAEHLERMEPWQGGGNMIADVNFDRVSYQDAPNRFEAGTGNIADAVGLGAALDYVARIGMDRIARYENDLLAYATQRLAPIRGVRVIGTAANKASVLSFTLAGYKTEEVGAALNSEGIAVRSGHHCAQPILRRFGVETTVRPSFAFYNTCEEIDLFISVVEQLARRK